LFLRLLRKKMVMAAARRQRNAMEPTTAPVMMPALLLLATFPLGFPVGIGRVSLPYSFVELWEEAIPEVDGEPSYGKESADGGGVVLELALLLFVKTMEPVDSATVSVGELSVDWDELSLGLLVLLEVCVTVSPFDVGPAVPVDWVEGVRVGEFLELEGPSDVVRPELFTSDGLEVEDVVLSLLLVLLSLPSLSPSSSSPLSLSSSPLELFPFPDSPPGRRSLSGSGPFLPPQSLPREG
jgi:hypothetical protein